MSIQNPHAAVGAATNKVNACNRFGTLVQVYILPLAGLILPLQNLPSFECFNLTLWNNSVAFVSAKLLYSSFLPGCSILYGKPASFSQPIPAANVCSSQSAWPGVDNPCCPKLGSAQEKLGAQRHVCFGRAMQIADGSNSMSEQVDLCEQYKVQSTACLSGIHPATRTSPA